MVQKGLSVINYQAKRIVFGICGTTSNYQCTNQTLYGTPVTSTDETTSTSTNVQIGVVINNIVNNKITYTINTISVTTTVGSSSTNSSQTTYTFPSGNDSLTFNYTFINTQIINASGSISNTTSPITVAVNDEFTQEFNVSLLSGINNWKCYFPYFNNSGNSITYAIYSNNQYVYPPSSSNTTNVQIDVVINNIVNNTIYYTIQAIIVSTTVGSSLTNSSQSTYTFPSGYDSLTFDYTFTNTDTGTQIINTSGSMSNNTSPITVTVNDNSNPFLQTFDVSQLSGINNWECVFSSPVNTSTNSTFTYNILTLNPYIYSQT